MTANTAETAGQPVDRHISAHEAAWDFFRSQFADSWCPEYLDGRGLAAVTAGYAPKRGLVDHLVTLGYSERELVECGLAKKDSGSVVSCFRDRLVLPVRALDEAGVSHIVAFIGRLKPGNRGPKYLNSRTTDGYSKGEVLGGLAEHVDALRGGAVPVICEGPLDAEAVTIAGCGEFVGLHSGGTAITDAQIAALGDAVDLDSRKVIVATDSDAPGRQAAARAWTMLDRAGARFPLGLTLGEKDPAAMLETEGGAGSLAAALAGDTVPLLADVVDARLQAASSVLDHVGAQVELLRGLAPAIVRSEPEAQAYATAKLLAALELEADLVYRELDDAAEDQRADETAGPDTSNVVVHPSSQLDADVDDVYEIPMTTRTSWFYSLTEEDRGIFYGGRHKVAPLPYVRARIIRRDGEGRRIATDYLLASEADGPAVVVDHDSIARGTWANMLGLSMAQDQKILQATATAIFDAASRTAPEVETTPRAVGDRIAVPVPETLPPGYLAVADISRDQALTEWGAILREVARSPKMAQVIAASAVAPFIGPLDTDRSHIISLHGDAAQGKSVTLRAAAAIWGRPGTGEGVQRTWSMAKGAVPRLLGQLSLLPAFFDETGRFMDGSARPNDWSKLIYDVTQGGGRDISNMRTGGTTSVPKWFGILFSTGNGRMTEGLGAGHFAGIGRRVVELETPLSVDEAHADGIRAAVEGVYGHLGLALLERFTVADVRAYMEHELAALPAPATANGRQVAKNLCTHLAGARMLDLLAGHSEHQLYYKVLEAACDYLDTWTEPEHDADRMLTEIQDSLGREPAKWPTKEVYAEFRAQFQSPVADADDNDTFGSTNRARALDRDLRGLSWQDPATGLQWVAVYQHAWRAWCQDLGLDERSTLRELDRRRLLHRTERSRRTNKFVNRVKANGQWMYQIQIPDEDDTDEPARAGNPGPVPPAGSPGSTPVPPSVPPTNTPLTCTVPPVPPFPGETSRDVSARETLPATTSDSPAEALPCVVCGEPTTGRAQDEAVHLVDCFDQRPPSTGDAPREEEVAAGLGTTPSRTIPDPPRQEAPREARFRSPVAVLDEDQVYLPGGELEEWPEQINHLGDLAMLAHKDQLRLGLGEWVQETVPAPGHLWLTTQAVLDRIGIPAVDFPDELRGMTPKAARKAKLELLAPLADQPAITSAVEAGWSVDGVDAWMRVSHPDLLPGGAVLVFVPWINDTLRDTDLLNQARTPSELADNLAQFAHTVGVPFFIHSSVTAHRLINHTRPLRREGHGISGRNASRVAAVARTQSELPPFYRDVHDGRFKGPRTGTDADTHASAVEADYSWWRPWDTLLANEQECLYVHSYDRKASYLEEWRNLDLGVDGLTHHTGADAAWDGRERPGLHLVVRDWGEWPQSLLPEPRWNAVVSLEAHGMPEQTGVWVATPSLKALTKVGIKPQVVEAWRWETSTRYLEPAAQQLIRARGHENPAVVAAAKQVYARGTGRFGRTDGMFAHDPLWRPDWYDHIRASARLKILITLQGIAERGVFPLAAGRDSILFASNEKDPAAAWPGNPAKLGDNPGLWAPEASGMLQEWGPEHLPKKGSGKPGGWASVRAVEALVNHKRGGGEW